MDIDFYPDAPPAKVVYDREHPELPTVPAPLEMITASLSQLLNKFEKLPIEEIGSSLKNTVQGAERLVNSEQIKQALIELNQTLQNARQISENFNTTITPQLYSAVAQLNNTLQQAQKTLADAGSVVNPDSPLYRELRRALKELGDAAQSIRTMADYLERHPDALLYGKGKKK